MNHNPNQIQSKENIKPNLDISQQTIKKIIGVFDNIDINDYLENAKISNRERKKLLHAQKLLDYNDLSRLTYHPIRNILDKINNDTYFENFDKIEIPEIVSEYDTFDLFDYPENHPARRTSDSYFITKTTNKKENILLRPHMSVMRNYYLNDFGGKEKLKQDGEVNALSWGKVYRLDYVDKTHHECFHQIDGLKIINKNQKIITNEDIQDILIKIISIILGQDAERRIVSKSFPFIEDGLELEVKINNKRLKVVGAGTVKKQVLENLGINSLDYNGWAFGFSVERLAMAIKKIPDIRYFWSKENRITNQWEKDLFEEFIDKDDLPIYQPKSISIITEKKDSIEEEILNNFKEITMKENISNIRIIDTFESSNIIGLNKISITINFDIVLTEKERNTNKHNEIYFKIREKVNQELGYNLR